MKRFEETGLWEVLDTCHTTKSTPLEKMKEILNEYLQEILVHCRENKGLAERIRSLNHLRSQFTTYLESKALTTKKLSVLRIIIRQALDAIDTELGIIKMDLEHPDRFIEFPADPPPLARWGGNVVDLIEYFIGPQAAGLLLLPSGKPMNYEESIEFLEKSYGITISNASDRRGKALDRQKNTQFQDKMRRVYLEEAEKRNL